MMSSACCPLSDECIISFAASTYEANRQSWPELTLINTCVFSDHKGSDPIPTHTCVGINLGGHWETHDPSHLLA